MRSFGAWCPVKSSNCCAACPTNISSPLTVLQPSASASCRARSPWRVCRGSLIHAKPAHKRRVMSSSVFTLYTCFLHLYIALFDQQNTCFCMARGLEVRTLPCLRSESIVYLYEACSKRRVDGVKDQPVALEGVSTDWALALHGVHANGGAVHEDVPSHLPAADCFQSCGPGVTAQSSRKLCCLFGRPARADPISRTTYLTECRYLRREFQ